MGSIFGVVLAATALIDASGVAPAAGNLVMYPEESISYTVLNGDQEYLRIGHAAWGLKWAWMSFGGDAEVVEAQDGTVITVDLEPARDISMDGDARIGLLGSSIKAGQKVTTKLYAWMQIQSLDNCPLFVYDIIV